MADNEQCSLKKKDYGRLWWERLLRTPSFSHKFLLISFRQLSCPYYVGMIAVVKAVGNSPVVHP